MIHQYINHDFSNRILTYMFKHMLASEVYEILNFKKSIPFNKGYIQYKIKTKYFWLKPPEI